MVFRQHQPFLMYSLRSQQNGEKYKRKPNKNVSLGKIVIILSQWKFTVTCSGNNDGYCPQKAIILPIVFFTQLNKM